MKQNHCITVFPEPPLQEVNAKRMEAYYMDENLEPQGNNKFTHTKTAIEMLPGETKKGISNFLKLPLYRQSHNFTCGVACVASVLRYAGYDFDTREDRLLWELGSTPEAGTNYLTIKEYLESVRYKNHPNDGIIKTILHERVYDCNSGMQALLNDLRTAIDNDSPVICVIQAWRDGRKYEPKIEDDGHYVVLIGYKRDRQKYIYYFMDPSTAGSYTYLTEEEFILRWHDEVNEVSKRIGIEVKYVNNRTAMPSHVAYHLD